MKIALLTYHRSYNYGAMLQAIATRYVLHRMGHQVYFINYWPDHQRLLYKEVSILTAIKDCCKTNPVNIFKLSYKWLWQKIRRCKYERFISQYIAKYYGRDDAEYDVLICGSDQIWRKQPLTGEYNPFYFGDNDIRAKCRISYASSMGRLPDNEKDRAIVKRLLENLDYVSVRESQLCEYINTYTEKTAHQVLDPTLLLTMNQWEDCVPLEGSVSKAYVLVYDLGRKLKKDEVEQFAKRNKLGVKETVQWIDFTEQRVKPAIDTPADFLRLIKNASFVLTSSFHGMALSISFKKPFYVTSSNNIERFTSLLKKLELEDRWLNNCDVSNLPCRAIDYSSVQEILDRERIHSLNYLKEHLNKSKQNV